MSGILELKLYPGDKRVHLTLNWSPAQKYLLIINNKAVRVFVIQHFCLHILIQHTANNSEYKVASDSENGRGS